MRESIPALIQELQEACRRSLYNGNSLGLVGSAGSSSLPSADPSSSRSKRRRRDNNNVTPRSWEKVRLAECNCEYECEYECEWKV
jgi:hypothetical protein